jgi:hypothetical protein
MEVKHCVSTGGKYKCLMPEKLQFKNSIQIVGWSGDQAHKTKIQCSLAWKWLFIYNTNGRINLLFRCAYVVSVVNGYQGQ